MNHTLLDVILNAWNKDIEPEDVADVLQGEGHDVSVETVRDLYRAWSQPKTTVH